MSQLTNEERELTQEELNQDITWERIREYHHTVGEDFLDQSSIGNVYVFGGWLLHKYPEASKDILDIMNEKYAELMNFGELEFLGYDEEKGIDILYVDYAEFCNQTEHTKHEVNKELIHTMEYYNE